jgi:hypothetical protein
VIFEEKDFPINEEKAIAKVYEYEAEKEEEHPRGDYPIFIARFPDYPDAAYTEASFRRTIQHWNNKAA